MAEARGWATRHWCGPCLVEGGHITQRDFDAALEPLRTPVDLSREERAEVDAKVREHTLFGDMLDRALGDPTYAAALQRAAEGVRLAAADDGLLAASA